MVHMPLVRLLMYQTFVTVDEEYRQHQESHSNHVVYTEITTNRGEPPLQYADIMHDHLLSWIKAEAEKPPKKETIGYL